MPRPHILTVALMTALTLVLSMLTRDQAQNAGGISEPHGASASDASRGDVHAGHHHGFVPVAAVQPAVLPRTGWTVTADSQEIVGENSPASNVLDGKTTTIWHTKWANGTDPLPHTLTVDMKTATSVAGLKYLPRVDGVANGRIGQYRIEVSTDGTTWGAPVATGTFADDATEKTAVFTGTTARYVRLTALSEAGNRGPWTTAAEINLLSSGGTTTTTAPTTTTPPITTTTTTPPITTTTTTTPPSNPVVLPRTGWTVTADSQETVGENAPASNVLDGKTATIWHTKWANGADPLPHALTVDMKTATSVAGLKYLPRVDGVANGRIGQYRIEVSQDGTTWGTPVATGTFVDDATEKTVVFTSTVARYVRFTALSEAGNRGPYSTAAEINLLSSAGTTTTTTTPPITTTTTTPPITTTPPVTTTTTPPVTTTTTTTPPSGPVVLPRTGWTVTADSQETVGENSPASNVLDGDVTTIWHTKWANGTEALPHTLIVDMKAATTVAGLRYLPRVDGRTNGRVGQYRIEVSTDGTAWGTPVATGTFVDDATEKTAVFTSTVARYVRFTALTEAGNRGPWTTAAEINLLSSAGTTTTTTPTTTTTTPTTTTTTPAITTTTTTPPTTTTTTTPPTTTPVVLLRTGWTVTADSQETVAENTPASNVLDGNAATIWGTKWANGADPLPHTLTIDMKSPATVGGLKYRPRADGVPNGRIGQYKIEVSTDGTTWGTPVATGTFADDTTEKIADFTTTVSARYVRLTTLSEAGNRGPWSTAAEINLLSAPSTSVPPSSPGKWDAPTGFPLVPVAAAMLPGGKVLTWSSWAPDNFGAGNGYTKTATLNLATGAVSQETVSNTGHDMFCPGTAMLADGRVQVNGGDSSEKISLYDPFSSAWSASSPLATPRGYQSSVTVSDGNVFTIGGSWSGGAGDKNGEIWSPSSGSRALPGTLVAPAMTADPAGAYRADNHMWLFAWTNGRVFQAGPSKAMNWYGMAGNGSVTAAGSRSDDKDAMNGNAVMYAPGRILAVGGSPAYDNSFATSNAYDIDITGPAVSVRKLPPMNDARAFHNSVALPDGKVLVLGGQSFAVPFSDDASVFTPELWDPATSAFTTLAPTSIPRNYHSVALLLPDGRVLSGGGGLCGSCNTNHFDAQIFTPPYLLNADGTARSRPVITTAPTAATAGSSISVTTDRNVTAFSLVRMASVTHSVDTDQRRIPLTVSGTAGTTATLALPSDRGVVVPGYYMLFALDAAGVPSVSKIVKVS